MWEFVLFKVVESHNRPDPEGREHIEECLCNPVHYIFNITSLARFRSITKLLIPFGCFLSNFLALPSSSASTIAWHNDYDFASIFHVLLRHPSPSFLYILFCLFILWRKWVTTDIEVWVWHSGLQCLLSDYWVELSGQISANYYASMIWLLI